MRGIAVAAIVCAVVAVGAAVGNAQALECNGRIVNLGASPWQVKGLCGEPAAIQDATKELPQLVYDPLRQLYVQTLVPVSQSIWTYNFGSTRFLYYLTFQEGKLTDIKTGGYGR
jgi:hypothetical protein